MGYLTFCGPFYLAVFSSTLPLTLAGALSESPFSRRRRLPAYPVAAFPPDTFYSQPWAGPPTLCLRALFRERVPQAPSFCHARCCVSLCSSLPPSMLFGDFNCTSLFFFFIFPRFCSVRPFRFWSNAWPFPLEALASPSLVFSFGS